MKIYTEVVIDIETMEVIKETSYEYHGEIAECKGGGGGGSGKVDYPDYMKIVHEDWLRQSSDTIVSSMTDVMNSALGNSPWTSLTAYDPDTPIAEMITATNKLQTLVDSLSNSNPLDSIIANVLDESRIDDAVEEFAEDLDARMQSEILPRFEAGMRDINMVVSSAFAIGRALIEENQDRQISKFSSDLHLKAFGDDALRVIGLKLDYQRLASTLAVEANRLKIVAKKEEADRNAEIDERDAIWDLEVFQHGANLLASIGGGTSQPKVKSPSTAQTALGGALSGAAAGAMATGGNPAGAAVGAVLGFASGLL